MRLNLSFFFLFFYICRAEQEGIDLYPVELKQFIDFMRRGNLPTDTFVLGSNQCKLLTVLFFFFCLEKCCSSFVVFNNMGLENFVDIITSIHENWFAARCLNTTQPAGEGAIVMQTAVYVLVALSVHFTLCSQLYIFFSTFHSRTKIFYCVLPAGMMDRLVQLLELWLLLISLHRS